jgi:hypothetical protein
MSEMSVSNEVGHQQGDEHAQVQRDQMSKRIALIRRSLPPSFHLEIVDNGDAIRLTDPYGFDFAWYPALQQGGFRGQLRTMRAVTVVQLLRRVDRERRSGS